MNKLTIILLVIAVTFVTVFTLRGMQRTPGINGGTSTTATNSSGSQAPLPTGEDIIRLFFRLIDDGEVVEAVGMMDENLVTSDSVKQQYGVVFNTFDTVNITGFEPNMKESWPEGMETYRVDLVLTKKPGAEPNLWEEGVNTRWVTAKKVGDTYKIYDIATGP